MVLVDAVRGAGVSTVTERIAIDDAMVNDLRESFRGEVISPADAGYGEHRKIWNGSIDRRPGLIARCAGVADVRAAVRSGREHGLTVAVRGGDHSFPGLSVFDDPCS
jgi:FAD/FMN-containing dehydrogenase